MPSKNGISDSDCYGDTKEQIIGRLTRAKFLIGNSQMGHVNKIPTMQSFTGVSRNTESKSCMLSLTECVWNSKTMHCGITINIPHWLFAL